MLTLSQSIAYEAIEDFINAPIPDGKRNDVICLSGSAGTGKSYLIRKLAYEDFKGIPTAVTDKASINVDGWSIYILLNIIKKEDIKTGKISYHLIFPHGWFKRVIFIDEASMIDKELWSIIQDKCDQCKIILVGDKYQLSVNSPANLFDKYPVIELYENNRQTDQSLIDVLEVARNGVIEGKIPNTLPYSDKVEYLHTLEECTHVFTTFNEPEDIALGFTDKAVNSMSRLIRKYKGKTNIPRMGDYMVMRNNISIHGRNIPSSSKLLVKDYLGKVTKTINSEITLDCYSLDVIYKHLTINVNMPVSSTMYRSILKYLANNKLKSDYSLTSMYIADLQFCNSSTVHLAQGDTYQKVLIHAKDILGTSNKKLDSESKARLFYTALSRAKEKVYIYDPENYFKN